MNKKIESVQIEFPVNDEILEKEITDMRNSLVTDRMDMSFGEILSIYEKGELLINPEFQRLFRWTLEQQTKFIESILLGIPIPPIFVAEDKEGKWELVDGLQRVSTIVSFFGLLKNDPNQKNNWTMVNGDLIDSLSGYNNQNIPSKYLLNIKRSVCRIEIIKWDSKWDMRFELFSRLNTGGAPLTDQEIRNCIFRGGLEKLYRFIAEEKISEKFSQLTSLSEKQKIELYDEEMILRFLFLVDNWNNVNESISLYLTNYMRDLVQANSDITDTQIELFRRVIELLYPLGKDIFRFPTNGFFSPSLFESITIGLAHNIDFFEANQQMLTTKIDEIKTNTDFKKYSGTASSSKERTKKRISIALDLFGSYGE